MNRVEDATGCIEDGSIPLIKGKLNTVALRTLLCNGNASEITYYYIYPVENTALGAFRTTSAPDGSGVISEGSLIFTPADDTSMLGNTLYAKQETSTETVSFVPQSDGTYAVPLAAGTPRYYIHAVDSYGGCKLFDLASEAGDLAFTSDVVVDSEAPTVEAQSVTVDGGLYTAVFRVKDDTYQPSVEKPGTITLSFDAAHETALGIPKGTSLTLPLNYSMENNIDMNILSLGKESSRTGIYEIITNRVYGNNEYYLTVTVKGVTGYHAAEGAADTMDFTLTAAVSDVFGKTGTGSAEILNAPNVKPDITGAAVYGQKGTGYDYALTLPFNVPVKPIESWLTDETTDSYALSHVDAFVVTRDGDTEISFYDIFGNLWTRTITLDDVFGDSGMEVSVSSTLPTNGDVTLNTRLTNQSGTKSILLWKLQGTQMVTTGNSPNTPLKEKTATVSENGVYCVYIYDSSLTEEQLFEGDWPRYLEADIVWIHVNNICKSAPKAEPVFFFSEKNTEYSSDSVPAGKTCGSVQVRYKTDRHVTAAEGSEETHTFTYGGATAYTFRYVDDFGYEGELTVDLDDYGVTLTEPPEPVKDVTAPNVNVDVYAKRFGVYSAVGAFHAASTSAYISDTFDAVGPVQGYSLKLNIRDESAYQIVLLDSPPASGLRYADAVGDTIDGASLTGSMINMTKPVSFYVAVIDNAKSETGADKDNVTYFALNADDMSDRIDQTPPVAAESKVVRTGLYARRGYIRFHAADEAIVLSPVMTPLNESGYDWLTWDFLENGSVVVLFSDSVGNLGEPVTLTAEGIDVDDPKLTVKWLTGGETLAAPPNAAHPATTNVLASVQSDKNTASVTASVSIDGVDWLDYVDFVASYGDLDLCDFEWNNDYALVTFNKGGVRVKLTFTAYNGKTATQTLTLEDGAIKFAPSMGVGKELLYRTGATVPYAVKLTLTPEPGRTVRFLKTGDTAYDAQHPYTVTLKESGYHLFGYTDEYDNYAFVDITLGDQLDNTAPQLTTDPAKTTQLAITSGSARLGITADEDCTLSVKGETIQLAAGVKQELTFTDNGAYTAVATDAAGNRRSINITIGSIDKLAPIISFTPSTVSVQQDSSAAALDALLNAGVSTRDNKDGANATVQHDDSAVDLAVPGLYAVPYTATDTAGNEGQNTRFVRVYAKDQPIVKLDGEITAANATTVLGAGKHVLNVQNLHEIFTATQEPFTVKLSRGILSEGQMKSSPHSVEVNEDGSFTLTATGFYTMYILSQSRVSYLTLILVEQ